MKPQLLVPACLVVAVAASVATSILLAPSAPSPAPPVVQEASPDNSAEVAALRDEVTSLRRELSRPQPAIQPAPVTPQAQPAPAPVVNDSTQKPAESEDLAARVEALEQKSEAARILCLEASLELRSPDGGTRNNAARLLAEFAKRGDPEAKALLLAALGDADTNVVRAVVNAVGNARLDEFAGSLGALVTHADRNVRMDVARALGKMPAEEAGAALALMLADADSTVVRRAIGGISALEYQDARSGLAALATHKDPNVSIEAALALKRMGDNSMAESLVTTFGAPIYNGDVGARRTAVNRLRTLNVPGARPYFTHALNDADARVKRDAQRGLDALNKQ